jgi:hypothetical protein
MQAHQQRATAGRRKRGPPPILQIYKASLQQYFACEGLLRPAKQKPSDQAGNEQRAQSYCHNNSGW